MELPINKIINKDWIEAETGVTMNEIEQGQGALFDSVSEIV